MAETCCTPEKCKKCECGKTTSSAENNSPTIFNVGRTLSCNQAIIYMAATSAMEVVYDILGENIKITKISSKDTDESVFSFQGKVSRTHDYLHEIKFDFPVSNFRFWAVNTDGTEKDIINLTNTETKILGVKFPEKLTAYHYITLNYSYTFDTDSGISARFDDVIFYSDYKILNPILTVSLVHQELRQQIWKLGVQELVFRPVITCPFPQWNKTMTSVETFSKVLEPVSFTLTTTPQYQTIV